MSLILHVLCFIFYINWIGARAYTWTVIIRYSTGQAETELVIFFLSRPLIEVCIWFIVGFYCTTHSKQSRAVVISQRDFRYVLLLFCVFCWSSFLLRTSDYWVLFLFNFFPTKKLEAIDKTNRSFPSMILICFFFTDSLNSGNVNRFSASLGLFKSCYDHIHSQFNLCMHSEGLTTVPKTQQY